MQSATLLLEAARLGHAAAQVLSSYHPLGGGTLRRWASRRRHRGDN